MSPFRGGMLRLVAQMARRSSVLGAQGTSPQRTRCGQHQQDSRRILCQSGDSPFRRETRRNHCHRSAREAISTNRETNASKVGPVLTWKRLRRLGVRYRCSPAAQSGHERPFARRTRFRGARCQPALGCRAFARPPPMPSVASGHAAERIARKGIVIPRHGTSFDYFICTQQQRRRKRQLHGACRASVDHEFEAGRLIDGQIRRFRAAQYPRDVAALLPQTLGQARAVGKHTAVSDEFAISGNVGQAVLGGEFHDSYA